MLNDFQIERFVMESWRIEGLDAARSPERLRLIVACHWNFLKLAVPTFGALKDAARLFAGSRGVVRHRLGMDVRVGDHVPPPGGSHMVREVEKILDAVGNDEVSPYWGHQHFEYLHPFLDGNGRTGRLLWAWHMEERGHDPQWWGRGFLHTFYYQSLGERRGK